MKIKLEDTIVKQIKSGWTGDVVSPTAKQRLVNQNNMAPHLEGEQCCQPADLESTKI